MTVLTAPIPQFVNPGAFIHSAHPPDDLPPSPPHDDGGGEAARPTLHQGHRQESDRPTSAVTTATGSLEPEPCFILPKCVFPPQDELAPIITFVEKAIQEQNEQPDDNKLGKNYKGILDALRFKADLPLLKNIMLAMQVSDFVVTCLTTKVNRHARLMHQLVRFDPFQKPAQSSGNAGAAESSTAGEKAEKMDYTLADAHLSLIVTLVSTNSIFIVPAMTALWKLLMAAGTRNVDVCYRVHAAIATILRYCPRGKVEVFPILAGNAPFRNRPAAEITWYFGQCLYVLEYVPNIEGPILELLVDKSLEMDVEIKINDGGDAVIEREDDVVDMFQLELEDREAKTPSTPVPTVNEMADRLDSLMLLIFDYVEKRIRLNPDTAYSIYPVLAGAFESSILLTHKSKFVQFLLLHLCGLQNQVVRDMEDSMLLYRDFCSKLIEVILDPYRGISIRQCAACYLASFISRASFVCPETICEAVSALLRWAEAYVASLGSWSVHAADIRNQCNLHALFYTVCQSAFYIMCFRGLEAVQFYQRAMSSVDEPYEEPERIDISAERWTRLCKHPLNPLRYCLESVRSEFIAVSKVFDLVGEEVREQLVRDNQRLATIAAAEMKMKQRTFKIVTPATLEKERQTGGVGGLGKGTNPLDSFFPFDPYLLHHSNKFVEPFYRHWQGTVSKDVIMSEECNDTAGDDENDEDADYENVDEGDEDDDDTSVDDDKRSALVNSSYVEPMSLASNASMASKSPAPVHLDVSVVGVERKVLKDAWATALKRPRAGSMENGSW